MTAESQCELTGLSGDALHRFFLSIKESSNMALTDHVAILAHASLHVPAINRLNPQKPASFYAQIAFPPAAMQDLSILMGAVAPGGNFAGFELGVKTNGQLAKPLPGIPADWFVVRASTQFAPYVADGAGNHLDQNNPANHATIAAQFYAGKKVRAALSAFAWTYAATGRRGISFNLVGVMASDDGERLNIGQGVVVNTFAQYADPSKAAAPVAPVASVPQVPQGNPFAAALAQVAVTPAQPVAQAAPVGNPFAQAAPAASANPFAQ